MHRYAPYATTVVGAHSVPRWYEALEKLLEAGQLSRADVADAQYRATQAALVDQEAAGIDVVTGGEMHRRLNNRHAPPNAMLNYFWQRISGFAKDPKAEYGIVTRPRKIAVKDANVFHPAAVCTTKITDAADLGLVDEFNMVSQFAHRPVKITMTGPLMLAKVAFDEYYNDIANMMLDLGKLMHHNFKRLTTAGCKHIQIDEPLFIISDDSEVQAAVEAINVATEGLPKDVHIAVHVCQGNYAVGAHYDGQLGHRYFDTGRYPSKLIADIHCDSFLIEGDMAEHYHGHLGNRQLGVGAADVQDVNIESGETIAERIKKYGWLTPEQTIITSSCGMNHLPRHIAFGKLKAMGEAKKILRGEA
jgi:5-methyltetrahydropteroyltriglutamate--homocysteine methyltransferase